MDDECFRLMGTLIEPRYVQQACDARRSHTQKFRTLLANRQLPETGWDALTLRLFLTDVAAMDSNLFVGNVGMGEREGRVFSDLVRERHYGFAHGIGRSGDIGAVQPKAAGSSLVSVLAKILALVSIHLLCSKRLSLTLVLSALRGERPGATKVIFCRIDQKSCVKSILTAGFEPLVIDGVLQGDQVCTNMEEVSNTVLREGAHTVLCVLSCSSCFAPRAPDDVVAIARFCRKNNVPHVINNAYGVQSRRMMHEIDVASTTGRVDITVQSTDKNFMVPVGGAILASAHRELVQRVLETYPGRASGSPSLDLLMTLLQLGQNGWRSLLDERERTFAQLHARLVHFAERVGERVLESPRNDISIALSLSTFETRHADVCELGSQLFRRLVSGARVVPRTEKQAAISGVRFDGGFGAHHPAYPSSFLTVASAVGHTDADMDSFFNKIEKVFATSGSKDSVAENTGRLDIE
ncbi:O-phosphoseryl-tRNA(Sec) selenium transferase [Porphyridium purpureum]|uniref:O-phosphoseryl-tRNA(Sec) selenium transferase n=1 Tax=Porphyridium purpureum TaxID=35688 RepID=A0A5J4Z2S1_PORPP|nr:O-phosphoseryl-tRNA(Sec) selenium transferase [Porphyridium purpureum]|eukprot:POR9841..scf208_2